MLCNMLMLAPFKKTYIEAHQNTESLVLRFQCSTFFSLSKVMHRALNESSYRFIKMKIRKRLQTLSFSFIAVNLVEKPVLHIFFIMVDYVKSAPRSRQQIPSNEEHF